MTGASYVLLARSANAGGEPEVVAKGPHGEQLRQKPCPVDRHRPAARRTFQPVSDILDPRSAIDPGVFRFRRRRQSRPGHRRHDPGRQHQRPFHRRARLHDLFAEGSGPRRPADRQGRAHHRGAARRERPLAVRHPGVVVPDAAVDRRVDLLHAPDAGRRRPRDGLWQEPGAPPDREGRAHHLRGRRRHRRSQAGARGDRRVPEGPAEIPTARREDPEGGPAGRPARHRQDAPCPRYRGRS